MPTAPLDIAASRAPQVDSIWLADLALSLPLPAGWLHLEHPAEAERYWYNEICNTAQWGHPIDELVRSLLKMHRNPRHAQVELMRNPSLARTGPTILGTEGASTRALESVVHAP